MFKYHEEVLSLQSMIPPKRFDISPPDWGMLRRSRLDAVRFFFKHRRIKLEVGSKIAVIRLKYNDSVAAKW